MTDHGEKDAKFWVESDVVSIGKDESASSLFFGREHDGNLLSSHGQNWQLDTIEFVEATPRSGLGQSWVEK